MTLKNQPSAVPTRKMGATLLAGAITAVSLGLLRLWYPDQIDGLRPDFVSGMTTLIAFGLGYYVKEKA